MQQKKKLFIAQWKFSVKDKLWGMELAYKNCVI